MYYLFNKTDSLCIVEVDARIIWIFAIAISDRCKTTLVPIIMLYVAANSTISTDKLRIYWYSNKHDFVHDTVCYKHMLINPISVSIQRP